MAKRKSVGSTVAEPRHASRGWFWAAYAVVLVAVTLAGMELIASFFVPSSPARDVRPISAEELRANFASAFVDVPELIPAFNDWGPPGSSAIDQATSPRQVTIGFRGR